MPAPSDEFAVDGVAYRHRRLSAAQQWAVLRRVTPVLPALVGTDAGLRLGGLTAKALVALLAPLRDAPDEVTDGVFADVRDAVERVDGEPLGTLSLSALLTLTSEVMAHNFGPLWSMERPSFTPCPAGDNDRGFGEFGPASMPGALDELYAPMQAGYCRYAELHDGSLRIEDVARMNDCLAVRGENDARLRLAAERG